MCEIRIPCKVFDSEEKRAAFIAGWKNAGGYTGDTDTPAPWCCPWSWAAAITVNLPEWLDSAERDAYRALGAAYWAKCRPEILEILEEERRAEEEKLSA